MRIAIDIDSTLHHYWDTFEQIVLERHGVAVPYEQQLTWGVTVIDRADVAAAVRASHQEEHVMAAEPYPGAVEAVGRWHAAGHFIHITSHRATEAYEVTARWLDAIGLPFDELYCSYDKVTRCAAIDIDLLIDDSPVNLRRAREHGIAGATILHPWNRDFCRDNGVIGADTWPELERAIDERLLRPRG